MDRRILTWSLNALRPEYQNILQKAHHKITSIGLHEFEVSAAGKINDFRSKQLYVNESGRYTGIRFPILLENNILSYRRIEWYCQMVLFGWNKVKLILENNQKNTEGRLPQDQFLYELNQILDVYQLSRNTKRPLHITGVEMDVEATMASDYTSQGYDLLYIQFLERIKNEVLLPRGLKLRVNAYAMWDEKTPYYYRFHNYRLFANSQDKNGQATIDEIQLMTYDFHWNGSSAGPSTPMWWFKQVAEWCRQNFDQAYNPHAQLTMQHLYFGAAAYGHRWGMHSQETVKAGSTVTYRNLLNWQNGYFRHYHTEKDAQGNPIYVYHDQQYLFQCGFQDEESKNQVMYPHVYDSFEPRYAQVTTQDGGKKTAIRGEYQGREHVTTNRRIQMPIWKNVYAIANKPAHVSGKAFAVAPPDGINETSPYAERRKYHSNRNPGSPYFKHLQKTVDEKDVVFVGYSTEAPIWKPKGTSCVLESEPHGKLDYIVKVSSTKSYHIVALVSFPWYTQAKLRGQVKNQPFHIGGEALPSWYPFFMKGAHWFDVGAFSLNKGENTISIQGEDSQPGTIIYGFVVCDFFDSNLSGGEFVLPTNIQPFNRKDGTIAPMPKTFAIAIKILRRDARPALLWSDVFQSYGEGTVISALPYYCLAQKGYREVGGGKYLEKVGEDERGKPRYICFSDKRNIGYSQGRWIQKNGAVSYDWDERNEKGKKRNSSPDSQLILSKEWSANLMIEAHLKVDSGLQVGIRFLAQQPGSVRDGYLFRVNFSKVYTFINSRGEKISGKGIYELLYETDVYDVATRSWKYQAVIVGRQPLGNIKVGQFNTFKAVIHNGIGRFYMGKVPIFVQETATIESENRTKVFANNGDCNLNTGQVTLRRNKGACGIYANQANIVCDRFQIATTDRWETLEKCEVTIDGNTKPVGEIERKGYVYDEYGYLVYSGLDERDTRAATHPEKEGISLDYETMVIDIPGWSGSKEIKVKMNDAGVWFGDCFIGDKEGCSVIWTGDAQSFLETMNLAINEYGAKGIGLWTLGQEDPSIFDLVPDVKLIKEGAEGC